MEDFEQSDTLYVVLFFVVVIALVLGVHIRRAKPAPEFTAPELHTEKPFTLSDHRGKVVVMDFWAPWCAPCIEEIPGFKKLLEKLKDEKGFKFVSVSSDADLEETKAFVEKEKLPFTVLHAAKHEGYDHTSIPTLYVIDCKGRLNVKLTGGIDPLDLEPRIKKALKNCLSDSIFDGLYLAPPFFFKD